MLCIIDISTLAEFVAGVKSTVVSDAELETLARGGLVSSPSWCY